MNDITEIFDSLLENSPSVDMAESDFKHMLADDAALRRQYREWCQEMGHKERFGFLEYSREYIERRSGGWEVFQDDDNETL